MREIIINSIGTYHAKVQRKEINCRIDHDNYCVPVPLDIEEAKYENYLSQLPANELSQFKTKS